MDINVAIDRGKKFPHEFNKSASLLTPSFVYISPSVIQSRAQISMADPSLTPSHLAQTRGLSHHPGNTSNREEENVLLTADLLCMHRCTLIVFPSLFLIVFFPKMS